MTASGTITRMDARIASTVTAWSVTALNLDCNGFAPVLILNSSSRLRGRAAGNSPDQQLGNGVDDDRDHEERQTDFDQGAAMQVAGGFSKLVGDHRSHRCAVGEKRFVHFRSVAYNHCDGPGFAEGAAQTENDSAHNANAR